MKIQYGAATMLLVFFAGASSAADSSRGNVEPLDEIIVAEHAETSGRIGVDVANTFTVDAATLLKNLPGADVNQNGNLSGIAQYRGMYGDRVAVTIDEHTIVSGGPNAMDAPLSYVSPMIVESIVVDRGIASVSSAPESIGGHLTAALNRGQFGDEAFGVSGFAGSRYSSNGDVTTSAARITVSDSKHRFSLLAEVDNGNNMATPSGTIRPSQLNRDRYDLSYALKSGENHLVLFAGRLTTSDSGTPALAMDIRKIDTDLLGGHFLYRVSPLISIEGRASLNDVTHNMDNFTLRGAPLASMQRLNSATGEGRSFMLASNLEFATSTIRFGLDGILAKHDSTITNPNNVVFEIRNFSDVRRDVVGAFAEWMIEKASSGLELGVRFKNIRADAGNVSASGIPMPAALMLQNAFNGTDRDLTFDDFDVVAKYRYQSSDKIVWQFGVARKSRAPSYQELYLWLPLEATGGLADGRTYVGDVKLDSEYSNEVNLSFTFDDQRLSVSPQVFMKSVDGYIQGTPSFNNAANMMSMMMSGKPALQFANTDARIWGADIAWDYALTEQLILDGAVSYVRGERRDIADNLYRLPPANANIGIAYQRAAWQVGARVSAYARQDKVSATNDEPKTPGYALVSTAFSWQVSDVLRIETRIHNLLDQFYTDHLAGINRAMSSDIGIGQRIPGTERSLMIGAMLTF